MQGWGRDCSVLPQPQFVKVVSFPKRRDAQLTSRLKLGVLQSNHSQGSPCCCSLCCAHSLRILRLPLAQGGWVEVHVFPCLSTRRGTHEPPFWVGKDLPARHCPKFGVWVIIGALVFVVRFCLSLPVPVRSRPVAAFTCAQRMVQIPLQTETLA